MTVPFCRGIRSGSRLPWRLVAVCAIGLAAVVRGDDDRAADDVESEPRQVLAQPSEQRFDWGANFDTNVFQQGAGIQLTITNPPPAGGPEGESPVVAAARRVADARLAAIDAVCGLSAAQRRTLELAVASDVRRVTDAIEVVRRKYRGIDTRPHGAEGHALLQQFSADVERCRQRLQGLCDAESLLAKVLLTTLDDGQRARLVAEEDSRRADRWRALVAATLAKYDDMLGLDARQYEALETVLLARQPRLRIDVQQPAQVENMEQFVVPMVLADVDATQFEPLLSERQRETLARLTQHGRNVDVRKRIESMGILERVAP